MKKHYLVTGGAGYIGSHMVKMLVEEGHDVTVLDNLSTGHRDALSPMAKFINCDLRNILRLEEVFCSARFDAVFHFAGRSIVPQSMSHPALYYENNVVGTLNLLSAMVQWNIKHIVFSSSAAVYGDTTQTYSKFADPQNPYGRTKAIVEQMLKDFDTAYGIKSVSLRYFNAAGAAPDGSLGERHNPETHLIPNAVRAALRGTPLVVYGDGGAIRDFVHVEDLCRAHLLAARYLDVSNVSDVFDLGSGAGATVQYVVDSVAGLADREIHVERQPKREGDADILVADISGARNILFWEPRHSLDDIIKHAIAWHSKEEN